MTCWPALAARDVPVAAVDADVSVRLHLPRASLIRRLRRPGSTAVGSRWAARARRWLLPRLSHVANVAVAAVDTGWAPNIHIPVRWKMLCGPAVVGAAALG